uniref:Uncharacterized protein n=1 Tax=Timema poppense TaxID=170557 RepID=A0A7R9DTJ0_TIMPO|nr:unnamed protein product [Timema poppensis]
MMRESKFKFQIKFNLPGNKHNDWLLQLNPVGISIGTRSPVVRVDPIHHWASACNACSPRDSAVKRLACSNACNTCRPHDSAVKRLACVRRGIMSDAEGASYIRNPDNRSRTLLDGSTHIWGFMVQGGVFTTPARGSNSAEHWSGLINTVHTQDSSDGSFKPVANPG